MAVTARFHRGFHRIGLVLALVVILQGGPGIAVVLVVIAALLYAAARAVGWILAGFVGSERT